MSLKRLGIIVCSLMMAFVLSGCLDLLSVPGVVVSPDSSKIYFLGLTTDVATEDSENAFPLTVYDLNTGAATVLGEAVGAFAVNPTTGELTFNAVNVTDESTSLMIVDASGATRPLIATEAMPGRLVATQMQYSPDGSKIALTAVNIPPDVALDAFDTDESLPPEVLALIKSSLYIVDVNAGTITAVSDAATQWANTLDWSPNGQYVAYNAWLDTDANGSINTLGAMGGMMSGDLSGAGDLSQIHIYNTADGSITPVTSTQTDYNPIFISDSQLAYLSADAVGMMGGTGISINIYDLTTASSTTAYQAPGFVVGMALSPDGTQVAWTQLPPDSTTNLGDETEDSENDPAEIYLSDTTFASPRLLTQVPNDFGIVDAPVWLTDGSGVMVTSSNIFASVIGAFTAAFSGLATDLGATPEPDDEAIPVQTLTYVNVADGTATVLYEGTMSNSAFFASVFSLSGMDSSGLLEGE